ncbi:ATP-binding cassette domain-containing protein [Labrys sp. LIt4]|uniref:ATP-binding cassette domain-containing protein n=1 Tax=Labrys sp. LIt4 TaxID=2821355 RepID=UPI001ADFD017|nr:ATP-binding cassette domain-containing protein [Labrys sp. LIt4]MBP0582615.1 ATP-binding cassette domain-containing protein [Labrys sp. LIt4]
MPWRSETAIIRIEKLRKVYTQRSREFVALDDVTLDIPKGAVFDVLGRNGAGKSTLIRCLNLLERSTVGRIIVGGHDLTALPPSELRRQRWRIGHDLPAFSSRLGSTGSGARCLSSFC